MFTNCQPLFISPAQECQKRGQQRQGGRKWPLHFGRQLLTFFDNGKIADN